MTAPFRGQFAEFEDVQKRFPGPGALTETDRPWVEAKIVDVEAILIGLLPSLNGTIDADRIARTKSVVCEKILDLRRGARGIVSRSAEGFAETYSSDSVKTSISFTEAELKPLRLKSKRKFGMISTAPWNPGGTCV